jgi:hypothetical protein
VNTAASAAALGLDPSIRGAAVVGVLPSSPAAAAGIQAGDVIASPDDTPIASAPALTEALATLAPIRMSRSSSSPCPVGKPSTFASASAPRREARGERGGDPGDVWVLQAVVVGGLVFASVAARRWAKRLERVVEDLELERAVFLASSASLAARLEV